MNEYLYDELNVGQTESFDVEITPEMPLAFLGITGDTNPLHNDENYAHEAGYRDKVMYGMLSASFMSTLAGVYLPGKYSLIHEVSISFIKPVFIGDRLTVTGKITEKSDVFRFIVLKVTVTNQNGIKVCRGKMQIGVSK